MWSLAGQSRAARGKERAGVEALYCEHRDVAEDGLVGSADLGAPGCNDVEPVVQCPQRLRPPPPILLLPVPNEHGPGPGLDPLLGFFRGGKAPMPDGSGDEEEGSGATRGVNAKGGLPMKAEAPNTEARSERTRPERELSEMSRNLRQSRLAREAGMEPKRRLEARRRVLRKQQAERSGRRGPEGELKERSRVTR
uniref:Uncharacterized protein n=1 Tax=Ananas comosus var. bracteatus TaxID=296719 RepID=A0A6V7NY26_ANACO|nr:unnamed protein product [Ananas comosus var. bracteatus]